MTVTDLQYVIDEECSKLCSTDRKVFRTSSVKDLVNFQWDKFEKELEDLAPTLWAALKAAAKSLDTQYRRKSTPSSVVSTCVVAAAALLKERNVHMTAVQRLLTLLLWHGNASTMVSHFSGFLI